LEKSGPFNGRAPIVGNLPNYHGSDGERRMKERMKEERRKDEG